MAGVLDKAGLEHLWIELKKKFGDKVDKEEGKGLSTEDYTTEEKERLASIDISGLEARVTALEKKFDDNNIVGY